MIIRAFRDHCEPVMGGLEQRGCSFYRPDLYAEDGRKLAGYYCIREIER